MTWFSDRYFNHWYDYINPANYFRTMYDNVHEDGYHFGDFSLGLLGVSTFDDEEDLETMVRNSSDAAKVANEQEILGRVVNDSSRSYLSDRDYTAMREDTAYQRAVADMRKAGLNPYTIGASPASSSASSAGASSIAAKVQILGYLLDLKNLDAKNRQITNSSLTNLLKTFF